MASTGSKAVRVDSLDTGTALQVGAQVLFHYVFLTHWNRMSQNGFGLSNNALVPWLQL